MKKIEMTILLVAPFYAGKSMVADILKSYLHKLGNELEIVNYRDFYGKRITREELIRRMSEDKNKPDKYLYRMIKNYKIVVIHGPRTLDSFEYWGKNSRKILSVEVFAPFEIRRRRFLKNPMQYDKPNEGESLSEYFERVDKINFYFTHLGKILESKVDYRIQNDGSKNKLKREVESFVNEKLLIEV